MEEPDGKGKDKLLSLTAEAFKLVDRFMECRVCKLGKRWDSEYTSYFSVMSFRSLVFGKYLFTSYVWLKENRYHLGTTLKGVGERFNI